MPRWSITNWSLLSAALALERRALSVLAREFCGLLGAGGGGAGDVRWGGAPWRGNVNE